MIPIHFGITGHRDLLAVELFEIKATLRKLIAEYKDHFTHTKFLMLTMLAEGADRVAADIALECGVGLIAISPMPLNEYEKDFSDVNSLRHFRKLWNSAEERIELPLIADTEKNEDSAAYVNRDLQYASGGAFLASHSQILIALWDGIENDKPGGTAYVIKSKLRGDFSAWKPGNRVKSSLVTPDCGPVYHIAVNRGLHAESFRIETSSFQFRGETKSGVSVIYPNTWLDIARNTIRTEVKYTDRCPVAVSEEYFLDKLLSYIDKFNHDSLNQEYVTSEDIVKNSEQLFPAKDLSNGQLKILRLYGASDSLAIKFQQKTETHLKGIAVCSFLAFAAFWAFDQLLFAWLYGLFWCFLASALAFYVIAKNEKSEDKFYDYRALAEGLRVQISWLIAGIPENVTEHYLEKYSEKIPWLLLAISNCCLTANHEARINPQMELARSNWVNAQYSFYSDKISKKEALVSKARNWSAIFVGLALFLAAAIGIWGVSVSGFTVFKQLTISLCGFELFPYAWLIYGVALSVAVASIRTYVADKRALQDEAFMYRRMEQIFLRGKNCLEALDSISNNEEDKRNVLKELGKEALTENGDWLLYQRSRPLEMRWG